MVAKSDVTDFASDAADAALMVPVSTLAKAFDLTARRVQQLAADGIIPKAERGRYPLIAAVQAYLAHVKAVPEIPEGNMDPAQARARKDTALAINAEIKNSILLGNLVSIDLVVEVITADTTRMKNKLRGFPTRLSPLVRRSKTNEEARAIMDSEIELLLIELRSGIEVAASARSDSVAGVDFEKVPTDDE